MLGVNDASCQLGPTFKLVHVMQVSETHIGNPRIIMTARILRHVPEHAAVQKLPSEALAVLQQNLGEVIEVSITLDPLYITFRLYRNILHCHVKIACSFHFAKGCNAQCWALPKGWCIACTREIETPQAMVNNESILNCMCFAVSMA